MLKWPSQEGRPLVCTRFNLPSWTGSGRVLWSPGVTLTGYRPFDDWLQVLPNLKFGQVRIYVTAVVPVLRWPWVGTAL